MATLLTTSSTPPTDAQSGATRAQGLLLNFIAAANSLLRDGYAPAELQPEALSTKMAIWIVPCRRLLPMIESGDAFYYRQGVDSNGPYRYGQFDRLGVAVKWIERPGCCNWSH